MKATTENKVATMKIMGEGEKLSLSSATNKVIKKGYSPYIGANGNWFEYDDSLKAFVDSGIKAKGTDGINGSSGRDGRDGYTPIKGIDYFDGADGKDGIDGRTPVKGVDYFDGAKGDRGDSYTITSADYEAIAQRVPTPSPSWDSISGKPGTFTPSERSHSSLKYDSDHFAQMGTTGLYIDTDSSSTTGYAALAKDIPTDAHINSLIDAKLEVIENGTY